MDDPKKIADLKLASHIAAGDISANSTIHTLLHMLGTRGLNNDAMRPNRSLVQGVNSTELMEAGFFLANACGNNSAMSQFGMTRECIQSVTRSKIPPDLPYFFHVLHQPLMIKESAGKALTKLECRGTRNCYIVFDDTVFIPGYL